MAGDTPCLSAAAAAPTVIHFRPAVSPGCPHEDGMMKGTVKNDTLDSMYCALNFSIELPGYQVLEVFSG